MSVAEEIVVGPGPLTSRLDNIALLDVLTRLSNGKTGGITRQALSDALRTLRMVPTGDANAATYNWTTAKVVGVTYNAGTCDLSIPNETDVVSWPVDEVRTLLKLHTTANVIGVKALANVGYNLAAVNTAITTLIGSAVIPGIATGLPVWSIWRRSATSYIFMQGCA